MAESITRVGGSGHTAFTFGGKRLGWMQTLRDQAPTPVAQPKAIQPMDAEVPREIVTPRAIGHGVLTLTNFETWNQSVWQELPGLGRTGNILDVFKTQVRLGNISCRKIIKNPTTGRMRTKVYYNCTVTDIDESETVQIGTMEMPKNITIMYTHARWIG